MTMSKSPTKQLADSNTLTKLADNFYPFESEFENKYFCQGKSVTSYILMNINELSVHGREFCNLKYVIFVYAAIL